MKIRTIIVTSLVTTVLVLSSIIAVFGLASPGLAQTPPVSQAPSLAASHLALPEGGGAKVWNILGTDLEDLYYFDKHITVFNCRAYEVGSTYARANATVHLPDGASIKWIRFYWKDAVDGENAEVQLRRYLYYDMYTPETLATVTSNGTLLFPLETYTESGSLNILVENSTYIYMVYVDLHIIDDDMRICSIQIGYTVPGLFGIAFPVIDK